MKPLVTMRVALADPDLFGTVLAGDSWAAWRILLIAAMGEPLSDEERVVFERLTGRPQEPQERVEEVWAIIGRRGGKTRAVAVLAAYFAALVDFSDVLAPGERASLPIMSASVWQAGKCKQYLDGIFDTVPALSRLVENRTADSISLSTRVDIECRPASFRTSRGGTCCAAIADEVAYWRSENSANPDKEILDAIRPSLATTGGTLACISSPYARRGELYGAWKRDFGPNGDQAILVAKAASRVMNPSLSEKVVARAYERDAAVASAEYGAEFRTDVEAFISNEVVDAAVVSGRFELPPVYGVSYCASVDAAGGSGGDSMTMAIAHAENDVGILDLVREVKPPFSPESTVAAFADVLRGYGIYEVCGDRWGGEFVREQFSRNNIRYNVAERTKSDFYKELVPLMNSKRIELLDERKLIAQLCSLERRTARGGRDSIDHPPGAGAHDDMINAAAIALVNAAGEPDFITTFIKAYG